MNASQPASTIILGGRIELWSVARMMGIAMAASVPILIFFGIAHDWSKHGSLAVDSAAFKYFYSLRNTPFHRVMYDISFLAGPMVAPFLVAAIAAGFAIAKRFWPDGASMLVAGIGGLILLVALKAAYHRQRPIEAFQHLGYSYPSGHSFFALVIYGTLAYHLARHVGPAKAVVWTVAILLIAIVGFSRIALGEHFVSDVVGGYALAAPWLWMCLKLPKAIGKVS